MSKATFTFGRFNPPTEAGHGKLISAVQSHAEETGGKHYVFPSHSQDSKKNPLSHSDKVGAMKKLFPGTNIASHDKVRTAIDAMKHLESKGHTHVTMIVGSDRVAEFHGLLNKYRKKEFPGVKKVEVRSAGHRDPDAEGAEGMSASKLRGLVAAGKKKEFVSHYSDPKLGAHIHDKVKAAMQTESTNPVGIFLLGAPGSGKDYVLNNIFSRFDLTEVQIDHILNGAASELFEQKKNIVINGALDEDKIAVASQLLEGYDLDFVYVSVTNKVSRLRNSLRESPLPENKRLEKWYRAEKLAEKLEAFNFNNSINLNESSEFEKVFFADQITKLLERVTNLGLALTEQAEPKAFTVIKEKYFPPVRKDKESGLPKKYVAGLSSSTAKARKTHWKKMSKLSDKDPRAYEPAPGDKTAKTKPSKHTLAVRKMMDEQIEGDLKKPHTVENIAKKHDVDVSVIQKALEDGMKVEREHTNDDKTAEIIALAHLWEKPDYYKKLKQVEEVEIVESDSSLVAKAKKSGISVGTLRKVYKRGVAAWNSGHRPGTTPQQWGHARVNSYINKGKTYHTADKDLREDSDINELLEMQLFGTDEYRIHAITMTPGQKQEIDDVFDAINKNNKKEKNNSKERAEASRNEENELPDNGTATSANLRKFQTIRSFVEQNSKEKEDKDGVDFTPTLVKRSKMSKLKAPSREYRSTMDGLPVTTRLGGVTEAKSDKDFMPTPRQVPAPKGGHPVPAGYERVKSWGGGWELRKIRQKPATVKEAVEYHIENKISFTDNVFRPGSEMFFEMINEAKRLYKEGKYTPTDEFELDMLKSNIGEKAMFEGKEVILDYPFEEELNEEDKTDGKGIGKPWREGGGGAVYVRVGDSVKKIRFSQSGMKKKYMDPGATRSFVARHRCLTNKDKTSASYWACRWPRFFSNSGKVWW